jgi:hypothetical protein
MQINMHKLYAQIKIKVQHQEKDYNLTHHGIDSGGRKMSHFKVETKCTFKNYYNDGLNLLTSNSFITL